MSSSVSRSGSFGGPSCRPALFTPFALSAVEGSEAEGAAAAMHIISLRVRVEITSSLTLKDKRQVIRSLLDRIRSRFNVSAAEVGDNDSVRYAELAVAAVANARPFLDGMIGKVVDLIESEPRVVLLEQEVEFL